MPSTHDAPRKQYIEPFLYPGEAGEEDGLDSALWPNSAAPSSVDANEHGPASPSQQQHSSEAEVARIRTEFEHRLEEESRQSYAKGLEAGRLQGQREEREARTGAAVAQEEARRQQAATMIAEFVLERDRYFRTVECEVVQLALKIADRILRREAQMDQLLLMGAVRVALGQLAESTQVRILVPEAEWKLWSDSINLLPNLPLKPAVVAQEGMQLGDCRIESELGSVDLGLSAQLGEIERGFFDSGARTRRGMHGKLHPAAALRESLS